MEVIKIIKLREGVMICSPLSNQTLKEQLKSRLIIETNLRAKNNGEIHLQSIHITKTLEWIRTKDNISLQLLALRLIGNNGI